MIRIDIYQRCNNFLFLCDQVLEAQFSAEIFASILSIPSSKTLLRRHLNTHFVALIGNSMQMRKREVECQTGFAPLTPNQKVKVRSRSSGSVYVKKAHRVYK